MVKRNRQTVAILLSFLLMLSSLSGINIPVKAVSIEIGNETFQEKSAVRKIDQNVLQSLKENDYVDVFLELTEQVNVNEVAEEVKRELGQSSTPYEVKMAKRNSVFNSLKKTAETSQISLLHDLKDDLEEGLIKDIQHFYIMNMVRVSATEEAIQKIAQRNDIARITLDDFIEFDVPDVNYEKQENTIEWNIDRISAPDVWNSFDVDGTGVVIGVIDTGVDMEHEAIKEKWRGFNINDPDQTESYGNWFDPVNGSEFPVDELGHGTHVTGTVLGQDPSGGNIIGVAPGAKWIAARAFTDDGGTRSDLLAAGEYMLAPEDDPSLAPDIIQNSWGGQPGVDDWFRPMVQAWRSAGQVPIFSAGNSGPSEATVTAPGNYPESYAVASTDFRDLVAENSSRGPSQYDGDQKPNISAPGVNIRSSLPGGGYGNMSGTSMAAPHVSGIVALLLSVDAALTVDEIEGILNDTADPLTDDVYTAVPNDGYGQGLVNAYEAVSTLVDLGGVTGKVLTEGSDTDGPMIEHEPLQDRYAGIETLVIAEVEDNVAVLSTEIWLTNDSMDSYAIIPMEQVSGDHKSGVYEGVIPSEYVTEPGFEYFIQAEDTSGNISRTEEHYVHITFGALPDEYYEDFTNEPVGWILGEEWKWDSFDKRTQPLVGDKMLGTDLFGFFGEAITVAYSPPMDLRNVTEASLRLNHTFIFEGGITGGFGTVFVSDDYGETWNEVHHFNTSNPNWEAMYIDLDDYAGSDRPVQVAFSLMYGGFLLSGDDNGWYLDNIQLVGEDHIAPEVPENLEAKQHTGGIKLTWDDMSIHENDINEYHIYRFSNSDNNYEFKTSTQRTEYLDLSVVNGEEYHYVIKAVDYAGNESEFTDSASAISPDREVIYFSDFENDDGGFTVGGTDNASWEWGKPSGDFSPNEAFSGEKVWGTNMNARHNLSENSWIESEEINLTHVNNATLHYAIWHENSVYFPGTVEVSSDHGVSWNQLAEYGGHIYPHWFHETVSLDDYVGETILLRFELDATTSGSPTNSGIFIDDVLITSSNEAIYHKDANEKKVVNNSLSIIQPLIESFKAEWTALVLNDEKILDATKSQLKQSKQDVEGIRLVDREPVISEEGIPLDATITVIETGRTTKTNPLTGEYLLSHPVGEEGEVFTIKAEAYGYYPDTREVTFIENELSEINFKLDKIPLGDIQGTVIDKNTGEPIANVEVRVTEDTRVEKGVTNETGKFTIENVPEGSYTLSIFTPNYEYYREEINIDVESNTENLVSIELERFIGFAEQIAYDTGVKSNAYVMSSPGSGLGVRMTPNGEAQLRGASFLFQEDRGGDEIQIAVFDTDEDGEPGQMLNKPKTVKVNRGEWTYIDLSEYQIVTDRDFFIVALQHLPGSESPAIGTDEQQPNAERSYTYTSSRGFQKLPNFGNFLIRADVSYALNAPKISYPEDMTVTNEEMVEVSGHVNFDSDVVIYNNDEIATVIETENNQFNAQIMLKEGENVIYAVAEIDQGVSSPSSHITVFKDTTSPDLTISSPDEITYTNREVVKIEGIAEDDHLDKITINGKDVDFAENGSFSHRVMLDEGENRINVVAEDTVGNRTDKTVIVFAQFNSPKIENILPGEDQYLKTGETVRIEFNSDPGLDATFSIHMPLLNGLTNATELPLHEVEDGHYVGYWTATSKAVLKGAVIEVKVTDLYGNVVYGRSEGKLYVNVGDSKYSKIK